MYKAILFLLLSFFSVTSNASEKPIIPIQATSCIQGTFSNTGNDWWKTINLKLTNNCGQTIDLQNSTITFLNSKSIDTTFWGDFRPLSYPDNNLRITSQQQAAGNYLATLNLHFPTYEGAESKLPDGNSITLTYGGPSADYVSGSVNVYIGAPVNTGSITLNNTTAKPTNIAQTYALVHLTFNNQPFTDVQVPWSTSIKLNNLTPGMYSISPVNIADSNNNVYQGAAVPPTLTLTTGANLSSNISYTVIPVIGKIDVNVQALPVQLAGYTSNPTVVLTNTSNGSATNAATNWNTKTTVSNLVSGTTYSFSTPVISFNGYNCTPTFTPTFAVAANLPPLVNLTYACTQVAQANVTVNVSGVPTSTSSIAVTFTPNNGTAAVTRNISLANGQGSSVVPLVNGVIYTVSSTSINGYTAKYTPQPLTATANGVESISYSANVATNGRVIGYLTGWKTPPTVTELVNAGYTHVMVAFGVFSTSNPGQITPAFDTLSASYLKSLQNAGIKVILSLGGALTSLPNTTVDFHQVLAAASSPTAFTNTFIQSLESLMTQYGFDGFDIDVEFGINAGGTFSNPQGDIAVLANILNTMKAKHPTLLLTLTPQTANVAVTSNFTETWGNYASLIMQTYNSLEWVGIQLYNTGCMLGLDSVCHDPNATGSPNFSVAMAADILEKWPAGYQPYISNLKPSQVVLGYLAPNAQGVGDGRPMIPNTTIKRAIQCLRTAVKGTNSCDTYVPPRTYPGIGGVFNWEISFDQNNSFKFAKELSPCVKQGNC